MVRHSWLDRSEGGGVGWEDTGSRTCFVFSSEWHLALGMLEN